MVLPVEALLVVAILLYGLGVGIVYADSAHFSTPLILTIRQLGTIPAIDYNLRRQGNRFLATLFFSDHWRRLRPPDTWLSSASIGARTVIERCFALLKRYCALKHFRVQGLDSVWRHPLCDGRVGMELDLKGDRRGPGPGNATQAQSGCT